MMFGASQGEEDGVKVHGKMVSKLRYSGDSALFGNSQEGIVGHGEQSCNCIMDCI